jgi:integrase
MGVRATPSGKYELRITHRLLPKPVYLTFTNEEAANAYGAQARELLDAGVVPAGLIEEKKAPTQTLHGLIRAWQAHGQLSVADDDILNVLAGEIGKVKLSEFTYAWSEQWVRDMKLKANLAPGTIRKRIGALARCVDWQLRKTPDLLVGNPLRSLPRGSATYSAKDAVEAKKLGKEVRQDVVRDRRLRKGELERILAALAGEKRADRQRPLEPDADLRDLFLLILQTGLRLREAYTIQAGWVGERSLRVKSSKQWHGREAWREVPMVKEIRAMMARRAAKPAAGAFIFPWWDGDPSALDTVTTRLSRRFGLLFGYAGCADLTEHDLRHEATCRWYEMRDKRGHWLFREAEIEKIMGWKPGSPMAKRYASFRAEDLADRLD